jgi:hypothetical protein
MEPLSAPQQGAVVQPRRSGDAAIGTMIARVVLALAGLGLVVGFFLPWIRLGEVLTLSGLGMALAGGEAITTLSGPFRAIVFIVPAAGLVMLAIAIRGARAIAVTGLACGLLVFATGVITLIRAFLDSTGAGMWVVVISALTAIAVGFVAYRNR